MIAAHSITTAEQLWESSHELGRCELVRGELRLMSPAGSRHGRIAMRLGCMLANHVEAKKLGVVYIAETGFYIERHPDTVRAPDVAFVAFPRARELDTVKFFPGAPDLAVEVNSPEDRASEVLQKIEGWLDAGAKQAWVVDPESQTITVYHADRRAVIYREANTMEGGDVLPGFKVKVSDVFTKP